MSYTIMYDKQFIKAGDKYIPMIFAGSNNCTMFYGGKEILERSWEIWNTNMLLKTREEILEYVDKTFSKTEYELFKEGSKWITGKDIYKWFENALNKACTLEEILAANPYRYIEANISMYHKEKYGTFKRGKSVAIRTTDELVKWLEDAYMLVRDKDYEPEFSKIVHCGFDGIEKIIHPVKHKGDVRVKIKGAYLMKFDERGYTATYDKDKSLVFSDEDTFKELIKGTFLEKYPTQFRIVGA